MDVVPNLLKCPVAVLMWYRTYRSVRYRHRCTDTGTNSGTDVHTGTAGTGIDAVPNLLTCPVPVLRSCRTYQCVRYRYCCRTELTEVSGTAIDVVPNLPKCPVPVIPAVCIGTYRTDHTLLCMLFKRYPFGLSTEYKSEQ